MTYLFIQDGWLVNRNQCQPEILEFLNFRYELAVYDGIIMKGQKLLKPRSLRLNMLEIVHAGHMELKKP